MANDRLRHRVAWEAARLLYTDQESECARARAKTARRILGAQPRPYDLPSNREIRRQLEAMAGTPLDRAVPQPEGRLDRFQVYAMLLVPLEQVRGNRDSHPEGDALYHSLQVFELVRQQAPYDEELLLAALLHDVGKAIDPRDHVAAALEALEGLITPRTAWLIEHHAEAQALHEGTLGVRSRRRLEASEDFEDLRLLAECDRRGRATGIAVPDMLEAFAYLRDLARACGE